MSIGFARSVLASSTKSGPGAGSFDSISLMTTAADADAAITSSATTRTREARTPLVTALRAIDNVPVLVFATRSAFLTESTGPGKGLGSNRDRRLFPDPDRLH